MLSLFSTSRMVHFVIFAYKCLPTAKKPDYQTSPLEKSAQT